MSELKLTEAEKADVVEEVKHYLDEDVYEFGVYLRKLCVTGATYRSGNFALVEKELRNAKKKHPGFVNFFAPTCEGMPFDYSEFELTTSRRLLANRTKAKQIDFESVLWCEVCEAICAYAHGELEHARQELAQCAAVCIRGMEYIQAELAKGK